MPKFFYTLIAASILLWLGTFFFASGTLPDANFKIFLFGLGIFLALGLTLTTIVLFYFNQKASQYMNKHILFKRSLKYGYFASFCLSGFLLLRAYDLASIVNVLLFLVLCAFIGIQLRSVKDR